MISNQTRRCSDAAENKETKKIKNDCSVSGRCAMLMPLKEPSKENYTLTKVGRSISLAAGNARQGAN